MAEWLGTGLQNPLREFESPRRLKSFSELSCAALSCPSALCPGASSSKKVETVLFDVVMKVSLQGGMGLEEGVFLYESEGGFSGGF